MNDEYAIYPCEQLEIRRRGGGGRSIGGRFGYSQGPGRRYATLRSRGRRRKERIKPKAFSFSLKEFSRLKSDLDGMLKQGMKGAEVEAVQEELSRRNVHILSGHDFNKPLGSLLTGASIVEVDDEEDPRIEFEVDLPPEERMPGYMLDLVKNIDNKMGFGVSPGFQVPPREKVPNSEYEEEEPGNPSVTARVISHAVLFELSIVSRASYSETSVDVRAEDFKQEEKQVRLWL